MKKVLASVLAVILLALPLCAKKITIFATTDAHGAFYPRVADGKTCGGYAILKSAVDKEKNPYLLLDNGDFADGSLEATRSKGLKPVKLMNAVGYSGAVLGNHDLYFGADGLEGMKSDAKFPLLGANIEGQKEWQMFNVDGVKIAVIGIGMKTAGKGDFKVGAPLAAVKKILPEVEAENPDAVILLVHYPVNDTWVKKNESAEIYSAGALKGKIDLVISGHAHREFAGKINETYYLEAGSHLKKVGKAELEFDGKNKLISTNVSLLPLCKDAFGEDKKVKIFAESLRIEGIDEPLGSAAETISRKPARKACPDSEGGNFIADLGLKYSGADLFAYSVASTAADIKKGPVTERDLAAFFPFADKIMTVETDGKTIKQLVRNAVVKDGIKYNFSGAEVTYRYAGGKVKDLFIAINGSEIEDDKIYTLASAEFVINGAAGGWVFNEIPAMKKKYAGDKTVQEIIIEEFKNNSPVAAPDVCRVRLQK